MGLFDDLLAPLQDLVNIKNEVTDQVAGIGDTLKEAAEPVTQPLEDIGVIENTEEK